MMKTEMDGPRNVGFMQTSDTGDRPRRVYRTVLNLVYKKGREFIDSISDYNLISKDFVVGN
jgi:hypothetical protein